MRRRPNKEGDTNQEGGKNQGDNNREGDKNQEGDRNQGELFFTNFTKTKMLQTLKCHQN